MKVDQTLVLATYESVKSMRATSERLGFHYNTVRKIVMASQGRCICGQPLALNRKQCNQCLDERRRMIHAKRMAAIGDKRCTVGHCRQPLSPDSSRMCQVHLELARERQRRYEAKQQERHGADWSWLRWRRRWRQEALTRDGNECILCHRPGPRLSVHHLHGKGNGLDNLTTLCAICHATLTRLLEHPDRQSFLAFLQCHYPS